MKAKAPQKTTKKKSIKLSGADIPKSAKKQAARKSAAKKTAVKKPAKRGASGTRKGTTGKKSMATETVYIQQLYYSPDKGFYVEYEPILLTPELVKIYRKNGLLTKRG